LEQANLLELVLSTYESIWTLDLWYEFDDYPTNTKIKFETVGKITDFFLLKPFFFSIYIPLLQIRVSKFNIKTMYNVFDIF